MPPSREGVGPFAVRGAVVVGALVAELTWLGWRLEAAPLKRSANPFLTLLGEEGVIPLAAAIGCGTVLCANARWRAGLQRAGSMALGAHPLWPVWLALQIASFVLFARATVAVVDGAFGVGAEVARWVLSAVLTLCCTAAALLPARGLRVLAGPAVAVGLAGALVGGVAWATGFVTRTWWAPLGSLTARVAQGLLRAAGSEATWEAETLTLATPEFAIQVAPSCSGYQGIALIWTFLGTYLWLFRARLRFPAALWLVPIGTVAAWAANTVRIAALVVVGARVSPELAVGGFHSSAGVLFFCALALTLAWGAQHARVFAAGALPAGRIGGPALAYVGPFLAVVTAGLLGRMVSEGTLDVAYPLRVAVALVALWCGRRWFADLRPTLSWGAGGIGVVVFVAWVALPAEARADANLAGELAAWSGPGKAAWVTLRLIGAVVTVPLVEELAFRGYLARRLASLEFERVAPRTFSWPAFLGSSLAFGVLHARPIAGTLAGAAYYLAMVRRGELTDAVVAHATTNALLAVFALATGAWWALG